MADTKKREVTEQMKIASASAANKFGLYLVTFSLSKKVGNGSLKIRVDPSAPLRFRGG